MRSRLLAVVVVSADAAVVVAAAAFVVVVVVSRCFCCCLGCCCCCGGDAFAIIAMIADLLAQIVASYWKGLRLAFSTILFYSNNTH